MAKHLAVFAFVAALGSFAGCADAARGLVDKTVELELIQAANEVNKMTPLMLDEHTRLDTTTPGPGKKFTYHYTAVNLQRDEIDLNDFRAFLTPQIINNVATHSDMKTLRDRRVTFVYSYSDKNKKHITTIEVTPEDYEQAAR